jgi:DNA-binding NarL/FixJ family response regulator
MGSVVLLPATSVVTPGRTRLTSVFISDGKPQDLDTTAQGLGASTRVVASAFEAKQYADSHSAPDNCFVVTPLSDGPVLPLIRMLRQRGWLQVGVLSGKADARAIHSALLSGVRMVVVKPTEQSAPRLSNPEDDGIRISRRELEVLAMVANGQTNREIGEELGLSALTVKSHLARIARKLGSGDRAQMVATAIRRGYIG